MAKQKIFIQKIELIDFESHKHTVLENFSSGFNCISGNSNCGKSAILRALELCAYNQFSQESVRLGAAFCDVTVTSNLGSVNVKRGKGVNLWTITRHGNPVPMVFDKVGKNAVEEACAVLGMRMIKLGDIEIPVNIMSQLERHFLISSVGDEKTSGSGRAEIIDEICGLNGTEELVKTISLDQYRIAREITVAEERINESKAKLHSDYDINIDKAKLVELEKLQSNIEICNENKEYVQGIYNDYIACLDTFTEVHEKIDKLPNVTDVFVLIEEAKNLNLKLKDAKKIKDDYASAKSAVKFNQDILQKLPVLTINQDWKDWINKVKKCNEIKLEYDSVFKKLADNEIKLSKLNVVDISDKVKTIKEIIKNYKNCKELTVALSETNKKISALEKSIKEKIEEEKKIELEIKELYKTIDICPVTKKPINDKCSLWTSKNV